MKIRSILIAATVVVVAIPVLADDCDYTAKRQVSVSLDGATSVRVIARAGSLEVHGKSGLNEVRASGTACTSRSSLLDDIQLEGRKSGSEIVIEADIPNTFAIGWSPTKRLDFVVDVPEGMDVSIDDSSGSMEVDGVGACRIDDSSGSIEVRSVKGLLDIRDSSGDIDIDDVDGDIRLNDGSGGIDVRRVTGTVTVEDDGSGSIDIRDVGGSVIVDDDGSGSIRVSDVKGDFIVRNDGSGGIHFDHVGGKVRIPRD